MKKQIKNKRLSVNKTNKVTLSDALLSSVKGGVDGTPVDMSGIVATGQ